jgi:hypothetical protein
MKRRSGANPRNKRDAFGDIRIVVYLCNEKGFHTKGNITRSFVVERQSVSKVFEAIERALLDE